MYSYYSLYPYTTTNLQLLLLKSMFVTSRLNIVSFCVTSLTSNRGSQVTEKSSQFSACLVPDSVAIRAVEMMGKPVQNARTYGRV